MHLKELNVTNFKNYEQLNIKFCKKVNCFVGLNGMGKTNLLDSIYYLSYCKSFFNAFDHYNVTQSFEYLILEGEYEIKDEVEIINCGVKIGEKKIFKRNKKSYSKLSDHIGLIPLVFVAPQDHELISEGSEIRRRFIDSIISQIDRNYLESLMKYKKILAHRNALLKNFADSSYFDKDSLKVWDDQMVELGTLIFEKRKTFIHEFKKTFLQSYKSLGNEAVDLKYSSQLEGENFSDLLESNIKVDLKRGSSGFGIHKDDFLFEIMERQIKKFGSQGQQKSFLLALKLGQYEYLRMNKSEAPLLLLDDIFDKLDGKRVEALLNLVSDSDKIGQVFITDTDMRRIKEITEKLNVEHRIYEVSEGVIKEVTDG